MKLGIAQGGVARTSLSQAIGLPQPAPGAIFSFASAGPPSAPPEFLQPFIDSSEAISATLPGVDLGPLNIFTDVAKLGLNADTGKYSEMVRPALSLAQNGLESGFPGAEGIGIAFSTGRVILAAHQGDTKALIGGAAALLGGLIGAINTSGAIGHHAVLSVTAEILKATPKAITVFSPVFQEAKAGANPPPRTSPRSFC